MKPSDIAVVLAAAKCRAQHDGWTSAEEVAIYLIGLGFGDMTSQKAAGYMRRIAEMEAPPIVRRDGFRPWAEYRVTGFGKTWVANILRIRLDGDFPHPSEIR